MSPKNPPLTSEQEPIRSVWSGSGLWLGGLGGWRVVVSYDFDFDCGVLALGR